MDGHKNPNPNSNPKTLILILILTLECAYIVQNKMAGSESIFLWKKGGTGTGSWTTG
jgi:hypothetical protein